MSAITLTQFYQKTEEILIKNGVDTRRTGFHVSIELRHFSNDEGYILRHLIIVSQSLKNEFINIEELNYTSALQVLKDVFNPQHIDKV